MSSSENFFQMSIENLPAAILLLDQSHRMVFANGHARKLLDINPPYVGLSLNEVLPPSEIDSDQLIPSSLWERRSRNGHKIYFRTTQVKDESTELGFILELQDNRENFLSNQLAAYVLNDMRVKSWALSGLSELLVAKAADLSAMEKQETIHSIRRYAEELDQIFKVIEGELN